MKRYVAIRNCSARITLSTGSPTDEVTLARIKYNMRIQCAFVHTLSKKGHVLENLNCTSGAEYKKEQNSH